MADDQTMSLMQCYLASILEANKVTNLTRITDGEQASPSYRGFAGRFAGGQ